MMHLGGNFTVTQEILNVTKFQTPQTSTPGIRNKFREAHMWKKVWEVLRRRRMGYLIEIPSV